MVSGVAPVLCKAAINWSRGIDFPLTIHVPVGRTERCSEAPVVFEGGVGFMHPVNEQAASIATNGYSSFMRYPTFL